MVYFCCLCKSETSSNTVKELLQHFYSRHGLAKYDKIRLCCCQESCMRTFDNLKSLGQHIRRSHPVSSTVGSFLSDYCNRPEPDACDGQIDGSTDFVIQQTDSHVDLKQEIAHIVLQTQVKMGQSNLVSDGFKEILTTVRDHFTQKVQQVIDSLQSPQVDPKPLLSDIMVNLETLPSVVQEVSTVYSRNKFLSTNMSMVQAVEFQLGTHYENRQNKQTGQIQQMPVADTFQYVPILETMQFVHKFIPLNSLQHYSSGDHLTE